MKKRHKPVLSCPFCGHEPEVTDGFTIKCVACAYGACPVKPLLKSGRLDDAIALWNTRPEATFPVEPEEPSPEGKRFWSLS